MFRNIGLGRDSREHYPGFEAEQRHRGLVDRGYQHDRIEQELDWMDRGHEVPRSDRFPGPSYRSQDLFMSGNQVC